MPMRAMPPLQRLATLAVLLGLIGACGPVAVEVAAPTDVAAKKKSTKPKAAASASAAPAGNATTKPSASPSPAKAPSASPSATTSAAPSTVAAFQAPSAAPSASAAASAPPPTGEWSGVPSPAEVTAFTPFMFEPVGRSWEYETTAQGAPLPLPPSVTTWKVKAVTADGATVEIASGFGTKDRTFPRTAPAATYTKERLTVPAGTYDTLMYEAAEDGAPVKTWLAKDIGAVQMVTTQSAMGATFTATLKLKTFKATP